MDIPPPLISTFSLFCSSLVMLLCFCFHAGISYIAPHVNNLYFLTLCQRYGVYHVIRWLFMLKLGLSVAMLLAGADHIYLLCIFIARYDTYTHVMDPVFDSFLFFLLSLWKLSAHTVITSGVQMSWYLVFAASPFPQLEKCKGLCSSLESFCLFRLNSCFLLVCWLCKHGRCRVLNVPVLWCLWSWSVNVTRVVVGFCLLSP